MVGDAGCHVTLAEDRVSERKPMLAQFRLRRQESTRGESDERREKIAGKRAVKFRRSFGQSGSLAVQFLGESAFVIPAAPAVAEPQTHVAGSGAWR